MFRYVGIPGGCVWKCRVPHCTQWFCWSLSLWKMAISLGILTQHFQTHPSFHWDNDHEPLGLGVLTIFRHTQIRWDTRFHPVEAEPSQNPGFATSMLRSTAPRVTTSHCAEVAMVVTSSKALRHAAPRAVLGSGPGDVVLSNGLD